METGLVVLRGEVGPWLRSPAAPAVPASAKDEPFPNRMPCLCWEISSQGRRSFDAERLTATPTRSDDRIERYRPYLQMETMPACGMHASSWAAAHWGKITSSSPTRMLQAKTKGRSDAEDPGGGGCRHTWARTEVSSVALEKTKRSMRRRLAAGERWWWWWWAWQLVRRPLEHLCIGMKRCCCRRLAPLLLFVLPFV